MNLLVVILFSTAVVAAVLVFGFWFLSIGVRYFNDRLTIFIEMLQSWQETQLKMWRSQNRLIDNNITNLRLLGTLGRSIAELHREKKDREKYDGDPPTMNAWRAHLGMDPVPGPDSCTCDSCSCAGKEDSRFEQDTPGIVTKDDLP